MRAVTLIADTKCRVNSLGGRFSHYLAAILACTCNNCAPLRSQRADLFDQLVDIGKRDVLVVYDFRRYQTDIVDFCHVARKQKATIILFTYPYSSPVMKDTDVIITTPVEVVSPYDSMTPALFVTKVLMAGLTGRQADSSRERISRLEALREKYNFTVTE